MRQVKKELGKLIAYAKGHGISVYFQDENDEYHGTWSMDGKTIKLHTMTPLRSYCTLIHELAHHRQFLQDGMTVPFKIDRAYEKDANLESGKILDKKYRKIIYETEKRDARHQLDIHYETQSTIPVNRLQLEIEYDLWIYKVYYKTGKVPSKKEGKEMRKSLTKKWKSGRIK